MGYLDLRAFQAEWPWHVPRFVGRAEWHLVVDERVVCVRLRFSQPSSGLFVATTLVIARRSHHMLTLAALDSTHDARWTLLGDESVVARPTTRFLCDILRIIARTSAGTGGRPARRRLFEAQMRPKPSRCHAMTVSG